MEKITKMRRQT